MILRPLTADDLDRVLALEGELFSADAWTRGMLTDELAAPGRRYLVAELAGDVVGYAGVLLGPESHIMTIAVALSQQRRGIGRALMTGLMQAIREAGSDSVVLEVRADDEGPQHLYAEFGFVPLGIRRGYYRGADALVMGVEIGDEP
ncbi:MAG: ribosomal protein S18-alanine N-acetyltransferase [Beutenbergiaceae bacterium]